MHNVKQGAQSAAYERKERMTSQLSTCSRPAAARIQVRRGGYPDGDKKEKKKRKVKALKNASHLNARRCYKGLQKLKRPTVSERNRSSGEEALLLLLCER